jgi:asparagine synthase (glutamine-hydrolysing)
VGLAHRRLAIIDLDERANQPFTDGRGKWLVFNGEIYNYRELRKELEGLLPDYPWRTTSDTEVLLASYAAWGEKCVEHLNGMFAFAVWDEGKGELFLARDRMGQKPLYYVLGSVGTRQQPEHTFIAFASEPAALRQLPWLNTSQSLPPSTLYEYLSWGYVSWNQAPFATVAPAETHQIGRTVARRHRYFAHMIRGPQDKAWEGISDSERVEETRRLVRQAVARQLVADVPVGCFLSGGIDSSIIAACMRAALPPEQRALTFSIGFDDPRYDETHYAAEVARHLGTEHHSFIVRPNVIDDLPKLAAVFGEPFGDSSALPTHYLARETRAHVKVALSGDGGDELFGGYDRYRAMRFADRVDQLPRAMRSLIVGRLTRRAVRALPGSHPKGTTTRMKRFMSSVAKSPVERYESYLRIFDHATIAELRGKPQGEPFLRMAKSLQRGRFWTYARTRGSVVAALAADRETYLPGDLLTKVDRCSMLHALEVRSAFMDHELVRFASTLTTPQLLKGGPKRMLREAFADLLPAWVFKRKKMGFAVPIGEWFRGELRPMLHDHLFAADSFAAGNFNTAVVRLLVDEHEKERVDHSQRLYALLMLELWWRGERGT